METNIPGNGPDHENILGNIDLGISRDPRRGDNYLGQILQDNCKYHPEQVIPIKDDEGAS